MVNQGN